MRRPTTGILPGEAANADFFGPGKHGFTGGTPGVEAATILSAEQMNAIVGELANVIELFGGVALDPAKYDQLSAVLTPRYFTSCAAREVQASLTTTTATDVVASGSAVSALASNPDGVAVAVGTNGKISYSRDGGNSWSAVSAAGGYNGTFNDVVWAEPLGIFVAVGSGGEIQTSATGMSSWTARYSGTSDAIRRIAFNGTTLMAVTDDLSGAYDTITSVNGIDWAAATAPNGGDFEFTGLVTIGTKWIASGFDDNVTPNLAKAIYVSEDGGASWTAGTTAPVLASEDFIASLVETQGVLCALVRNIGNNDYKVIRSTDEGATWQAGVSLPSSWADDFALVGGFYAVLAIPTTDLASKMGFASYDLGATWHSLLQPGFAGANSVRSLNWSAASATVGQPGTRRWAGLSNSNDLLLGQLFTF